MPTIEHSPVVSLHTNEKVQNIKVSKINQALNQEKDLTVEATTRQNANLISSFSFGSNPEEHKTNTANSSPNSTINMNPSSVATHTQHALGQSKSLVVEAKNQDTPNQNQNQQIQVPMQQLNNTSDFIQKHKSLVHSKNEADESKTEFEHQTKSYYSLDMTPQKAGLAQESNTKA